MPFARLGSEVLACRDATSAQRHGQPSTALSRRWVSPLLSALDVSTASSASSVDSVADVHSFSRLGGRQQGAWLLYTHALLPAMEARAQGATVIVRLDCLRCGHGAPGPGFCMGV